MATGDILVKLIEEVLANYGNDGFICGEVVKVDKKNLTCDIKLDENLTLPGCRLNAVEMPNSTNHVTVFPKMGSYVSGIATADLRDVLIVSISEVESVEIKADKVIINDLKTQLNKMSARIDGIIDALNNCGSNNYGGALQAKIVTALKELTDKENFNTLFDYESNQS